METFNLPASLDEMESKEEAVISRDRVGDAPEWFIIALVVSCVRPN